MSSIYKELYGEVETPLFFVEKMFEMIPKYIFKNKDLKWLDVGSGNGVFSMYLYNILFKSLEDVIINPQERKAHIIENMIYMVEINDIYETEMIYHFGSKVNLYIQDFLQYFNLPKIDIIIGNPPFNSNSIKKVPTNKVKKKTNDGHTIWVDIIKKSLRILNENGYLLTIIPCMWMKPDKASMYQTITQYKIHILKTLSGNKANKVFKKQAQTPCSYFLLQKKPTDGIIPIYDEEKQNIVNYNFLPNYPIPIYGATVINKLKKYVVIYGHLKVNKTNDISKKCKISDIKSEEFMNPNIHTCHLNGLDPKLVIKYSDIPCSYFAIPKIVMAHGMYGFPFYDPSGNYGISNRDKFVIFNKTREEFKILFEFLNTKLARYLFEATRYRMKYLEKYIFELIPNICNLPELPLKINDETMADYFKLNKLERFHVNHLHKKQYNSFSF